MTNRSGSAAFCELFKIQVDLWTQLPSRSRHHVTCFPWTGAGLCFCPRSSGKVSPTCDPKEMLHGNSAPRFLTFERWTGRRPERSSNVLKVSKVWSEKGEIQIQVHPASKPITCHHIKKVSVKWFSEKQTCGEEAHTSTQLETLGKKIGSLFILFFNVLSLLLALRNLSHISQAQEGLFRETQVINSQRKLEKLFFPSKLALVLLIYTKTEW